MLQSIKIKKITKILKKVLKTLTKSYNLYIILYVKKERDLVIHLIAHSYRLKAKEKYYFYGG